MEGRFSTVDELVLESHGKMIKMLIHDKLWCEVYLIRDDGDVALGGERLDKINSGLLIASVSPKERKYFIYQNMELFTVFNLMGPHAVVAGREKDNCEIELIFLSNEGNVMPMLTLSNDDIKEWINKITKIMTEQTQKNISPKEESRKA